MIRLVFGVRNGWNMWRGTRGNVGEALLDGWAAVARDERRGGFWTAESRRSPLYRYTHIRVFSEECEFDNQVVLVEPTGVYRREVGPVLERVMRRFGVFPRETLVVHADLWEDWGGLTTELSVAGRGVSARESVLNTLSRDQLFWWTRVGLGWGNEPYFEWSGDGEFTVNHFLNYPFLGVEFETLPEVEGRFVELAEELVVSGLVINTPGYPRGAAHPK